MKLAFFALRCYYPIGFYFVYVFCASILKNKFNYTSAEIIQQNFLISILEVSRSIIIPILSYYIYPLKIMRFKVILFFLGIVICPYLLNAADSGHYIFWIQVYFVIIMLSSSPGLPIFYSYLPIMNRSLNGGWIYALSHAIMYAFSSFGITYVVKEFNFVGLFIIMIPIGIFYTFGLNYFIKLEKENGYYSI